jgi:hypothetical protein
MRRTLASLLALLCGCGSGVTGSLEEHLSIRAVEVRQSGPATVRAVLRSPGLLAELIRSLEGTSVRHLRADAEVDAETAEASRRAGYCVELQPYAGRPDSLYVTCEVDGLSWSPDYSWSLAGGEVGMTGRIRLSNATDTDWSADTVLVLDRDGTVLARAEGVGVPPGTVIYPWWRSNGSAHGPVVSFGWPEPGRARAMLAFFPRMPGPVVSSDMLPAYGGDTLWLPADGLLRVDQRTAQLADGYSYRLRLTNTTDSAVTAELRFPARLPRGTVLSGRPPGSLTLQPGATDSLALLYRYRI